VIFTSSQGYPALASGLGYASAAGVFILAHFLRGSFPHMVFMLNISGHILIYYVTLQLYFFSPHPLIPWKVADLILLMMAIGVQIYLAIRQSSELLTGVALILVIVTALIGDSLYLTFSLITADAAFAIYLLYRFNWWRLLVVSLILVYLSHILWLINNPLLGHPIEIVPSHPYNLIYLFACGILYSLSILLRRNTEFAEKGLNSMVLLNGLWFALTILLVTANYYPTNYMRMFGAIAGFCLLFSIWLNMKIRTLFVPAFFACFGFMSLSVSLYGYAKLPDAYFFLALQSFLVVSMALWFRSRIIVVVNTVLYMGILMIYLVSSHPVDRISFCFAIVAFATARILNLKKERLTLKTDLMRNIYLAALFFTMLFAFYHAVPGRYITLSWTAVAAGYFLLSFLLRNIKYRWMAIATLLVTVVYLFLVDLANLSIGYRVVAFLFLAVISISASLYYTRRMKKKRIIKQD
jgi:membrane protein implicated in regulation of membrane protease activity